MSDDKIISASHHHTLSYEQKRKMVLHSFIVIGIGLLGGMAWVIVLGGKLELWPIPPIEFDLPETKELWRNAHIGPIMNGIFVLAIVGASSYLTLGKRALNILYYLTIIMLWGNTIGYQTSPFTTNRGLGTSSNFLNSFCYFSFYIAALCALVLVGICIYGSWKRIRDIEH